MRGAGEKGGKGAKGGASLLECGDMESRNNLNENNRRELEIHIIHLLVIENTKERMILGEVILVESTVVKHGIVLLVRMGFSGGCIKRQVGSD